jgi:diadenylate cyclase
VVAPILDFIRLYWKAAFEIFLLAALIYYVLLLFRGTRGAAVLTGFITTLVLLGGLTRLFELDVINWILGRVLAFLAIAVLVIFQPEIRRALAQLGSKQLFGSSRQRGVLIDVIVEAARSLSQRRCGALIAVEREIGFRGIVETGVPIDARATPELLTTIFLPNTPLHDGGVVLRGDRIAAAGCVFPLTQRDGLGTSVGMRHRAAIGLTEETDAVTVAVSEETGEISVALRGHLVKKLNPEGLRKFLATTLTPGAPARALPDFVRKIIGALNLREPRSGPEEEFAEDANSFGAESEDPGAATRATQHERTRP